MSGRIPSAAYLDAFRSLPVLRGFWSLGQNRWQGSINTIPNMTLNFDFATPTGSGDWISLGTQEDNVYINLNGSTDFVSIGPSKNYNPNLIDSWVGPGLRGMTIGGWIRPDTTASSSEYLMARRDAATNLCFGFYRNAAGNMTFDISTNGTSFHKSLATTGGPASAVSWYFMVAQISQTEMRIFINGEWWSTTSGLPSTIYQTTGVALTLGARQNGAGSAFHLDGRLSSCFLTGSYLPTNMVETLWHVTRKGFRL